MIKNHTRLAFLRLTTVGSLAFASDGLGLQSTGNWISDPLPSEKNIHGNI